MPRPRTVYRGKLKYSWLITLAVFVLVILIIVAVWLFSYLQRFIVYDKDGLQLVLPAERGDTPLPGADSSGTPAAAERVEVDIVVDRTDYSDVVTTAGSDLQPLRALFVPAADMTERTLAYYADGVGDFNAIVLELKGPDGFLRYRSGVSLAERYGVNGALELGEPLAKLKAKGVRLVAQLSCLVDETMAERNTPVALKSAVTDSVFKNSQGAWLDPYSDVVRAYLTDLLQELHDLGFDEVLLSGLYCPDSENLQFSQAMTLAPDRSSAVSSFALYLRAQAEEIGIALSATAEADRLAAGTGEAIGQDLGVFFKAFDRVAFDTAAADSSVCMAALEAALGSGDGAQRILPIAEDYAPEHESYIVK